MTYPHSPTAVCCLEKKRTLKLKYQLVVTTACCLILGVGHIVLDFTNAGVIHPHIFVATVGVLCYCAGQLSKADLNLRKLVREITGRGLDRSKLTTQDYVEVVATGMSVALGACGAVEVLDLAFGVHTAGPRKRANHLQ